IWKHMKELEKEGFQIEGKSRVGYRIISSPRELSEYTIQAGLETEWLGEQIIHKEVINSTQRLAHTYAGEKAKHGTVIIADEQTEGRGRLDRPWTSSKEKGMWMSMILRPTIAPYLAPQLTLLTATVLADVLKNYTNLKPKIKWPNDILINGKKVAGILTEMQAEQDQILYVVIGIGLNVNQEKNDFPEDIDKKATSIHIETEREWNIHTLIQSILETFEKAYEAYIE